MEPYVSLNFMNLSFIPGTSLFVEGGKNFINFNHSNAQRTSTMDEHNQTYISVVLLFCLLHFNIILLLIKKKYIVERLLCCYKVAKFPVCIHNRLN